MVCAADWVVPVDAPPLEGGAVAFEEGARVARWVSTPGGSRDRVLCSVVNGKVRHEKGVTEWHELIDAASRVRGRMLADAPGPHPLPELA